LFYTEWNSNATCTSPVNDAPYNAGFIIKSIVDLQGMVQMYSFWTFSDIFEELNFFSEPFNGSFGMLTIHGIPKPSFWGFKMLSKLGDERIDLPTTCDSPTLEMVATKKENSIQILLYNHQVPLKPIEKESVGIEIEGINAIKEVTIERIDEDHGNPKKFWIEMDSPDYLKPEEVEDIKEKSKVIPESLEFSIENDILKINLIIPEQGVALISLNGIN
ncbi:MAG: beta-xylosidase, partial [archaeon]|nr:beta-xylosidase [archaeon]